MEVNSEHDKNSLFIDLLFKTPQTSSKKCYWEPFRTPFFSFFCARGRVQMVNFLGQVRNKRKTLVFNCFDVVFFCCCLFQSLLSHQTNVSHRSLNSKKKISQTKEVNPCNNPSFLTASLPEGMTF